MSEDVIIDAPDGYRPATAIEAIDFAAKHPELQRWSPIVALGSFTLGDGDDRRVVAVLDIDRGERGLGDGWFAGVWRADCRFLFVRKTSSC